MQKRNRWKVRTSPRKESAARRFGALSLPRCALILLTVFLSLSGLSCTGSQQEENGKIRFKKIKSGEGRNTPALTGFGVLEAGETIPVRSTVEGEVSWLAKEGSYVKRGDLVARMTCKEIEDEHDETSRDLAKAEAELRKSEQSLRAVKRDAEDRLEQAELELKFAELQAESESRNANQDEKTLCRAQEKVERARRVLSNVKASNANAIRAAQKNVSIKEQEFLRLQKKLNRDEEKLALLSLHAPAEGIVIFANLDCTPPIQTARLSPQETLSKRVQIGDSRWRGADVLRIAVLTDMRARIHVRESDIDDLRLNQKAKITVDDRPDAAYEGSVVEVFPHSEDCSVPLHDEGAGENKENTVKRDSSRKPRRSEPSQSSGEGEDNPLGNRNLEETDGLIDVIIKMEGVAQAMRLGAKVKAEIDVSKEHPHE